MGIFSRMRDIIHSNINNMLEKAEDPEKLIKLMIQEMEDTLVEIKSACAGAMASEKKVKRALEETNNRVAKWAENAEMAVRKGREDLAREALLEKRKHQESAERLENEVSEAAAIAEQYKSDISALEEKLAGAREKHRVLVERHIHATQKKQVHSQIRKSETSDAFVRFEDFQNRIERMESDADLADYGRKPSLDQQFSELAGDSRIDEELENLKASIKEQN